MAQCVLEAGGLGGVHKGGGPGYSSRYPSKMLRDQCFAREPHGPAPVPLPCQAPAPIVPQPRQTPDRQPTPTGHGVRPGQLLSPPPKTVRNATAAAGPVSR